MKNNKKIIALGSGLATLALTGIFTSNANADLLTSGISSKSVNPQAQIALAGAKGVFGEDGDKHECKSADSCKGKESCKGHDDEGKDACSGKDGCDGKEE